MFQSTHPCGVRQNKYKEYVGDIMFQSTHPCGVRQTHTHLIRHAQSVSIHAPVWGATRLLRLVLRLFRVSIHAPVWGATHIDDKLGVSKGFNPRTRVGCDARLRDTRTILFCFNPRTRVGCDTIRRGGVVKGGFQSTHPCGVRRQTFLSSMS